MNIAEINHQPLVSQNPLVSIILPTFNRHQYIRGSIDSCLNQTYRNIEIIIINDGSTDQTDEIIKTYSDPRIRYICQSSNLGLPKTLNKGFQEAKGEYLTWISDDNFFTSNAIEIMLSTLMINKVEYVFSDLYTFTNDVSDKELYKTKFKLKLGNGIGACFLYSKKVRQEIGDYDPETGLVEDYDYWIRISKKYHMFHIDIPLYYYRRHPQSLYETHYYTVHILLSLISLKWKISNRQETKDHLIKIIIRNTSKINKYRFKPAKLLLGLKINSKLKSFEKNLSTLDSTKKYLQQFVI